MAQNMVSKTSWLWRSRSKVKINDTIWFLDLKTMDLVAKIVILSVLVQKLWSKMSLCIMVANKMRSRTSHIQTAQNIFIFFKGPNANYSMLKFGDNLSSSNCDMVQNVILLVCDLERSRSFSKVKTFLSDHRHLPISICLKFHQNLIASCSVMVF